MRFFIFLSDSDPMYFSGLVPVQILQILFLSHPWKLYCIRLSATTNQSCTIFYNFLMNIFSYKPEKKTKSNIVKSKIVSKLVIACFVYFFWNYHLFFNIISEYCRYRMDRIRVLRRPVCRIRIILIRIQDGKKFVTDPNLGWTLIRIRIQAKTIRIRIQGNGTDSTDPDPPHWRRLLDPDRSGVQCGSKIGSAF